MLFTSKEDVALHVMQGIKLVATKRGLRDVEWRGSDELLAELEQVDPSTCAVLMAYINAYRAWHEYHLWIEKNGKAGRLNDHERTTLDQRLAERDATRRAIVARVGG